MRNRLSDSALNPHVRTRRRATAVLLGLLLCGWFTVIAASTSARDRVRIPVHFRVAKIDGHPVAPEAFLTEQLARANDIYRPLGVELIEVGRSTLPKAHARMRSRADRDRLGDFLAEGVINIMIVATLMDVDEPGRERRGVHWTHRTQRERHYVIVSAISSPYVLAHELGHFFGNREHSETPGNLMSYQWRDTPPVLDEAQKEKVRQTVRRMLADGELRNGEAAEPTRERSVKAKQP